MYVNTGGIAFCYHISHSDQQLLGHVLNLCLWYVHRLVDQACKRVQSNPIISIIHSDNLLTILGCSNSLVVSLLGCCLVVVQLSWSFSHFSLCFIWQHVSDGISSGSKRTAWTSKSSHVSFYQTPHFPSSSLSLLIFPTLIISSQNYFLLSPSAPPPLPSPLAPQQVSYISNDDLAHKSW